MRNPLKLIIKPGTTRSAIRRHFFVDISKVNQILNEDAKYSSERLCFTTNCKSGGRKTLNGYKMLTFDENDTVVVLGGTYNKIALGFVLESYHKQCSIPMTLVECGTIPTSALDWQCMSSWPQSDRPYEISAFELIGLYSLLDHVSDAKTLEIVMKAQKLGENGGGGTYLAKHSKQVVIKVGYAKLDFKTQGYTGIGRKAEKMKIDVNLEGEEIERNMLDNDDYLVPLLNYTVGEMILVTKEPNQGGWFEGYKARDSEYQLGLSHQDFVVFLEF